MTDEPKYKIGDPVWSKMRGYSPWPSRIAAPYESRLENKLTGKQSAPKIFYLVYFFGSNNYAWMPEESIKPYAEFLEKNKNGGKTAQFKQGLKQIDEYVNTGGQEKLLEDYKQWQEENEAAIKNETSSNNDLDESPLPDGDSLNEDQTNAQGELLSIDDEIAAINNRKPAAVSPKKQKSDSHNSDNLSSPTTPSGVQRDYSRTPFKTKSKTAARGDDPPATETTSPTKRVKTNEDYRPNTPVASEPFQMRVKSSCLDFGVEYEYLPTSPSRPADPNVRLAYFKQPSKSGPRNVLLRATQHTEVPAIERPNVIMDNTNAKARSIRPSILRFGFIGLGFLGQRLLKNLLSSGHQVSIYNRSSEKCKQFLEAGAKNQDTPADVVENSDIVFSCVSGPDATKEVVFGTFGIVTKMDCSKSYVEMSSIDPATSNDISEAITERGGRYLEAPPVLNGRTAAEEGELTILAAGEKTLYEECSSCFQAMSKQTFFLGHRVGYASKMNLIISTLYGNMAGAIAECCALLERSDLQLKSLQEILRQSIMHSPLIDTILDKIISKDNSINMPLFQLQKDLRLSLSIAEECEQTCPITAITNEVFKQAKKAGYSEYDVSAVYFRSRF